MTEPEPEPARSRRAETVPVALATPFLPLLLVGLAVHDDRLAASAGIFAAALLAIAYRAHADRAVCAAAAIRDGRPSYPCVRRLHRGGYHRDEHGAQWHSRPRRAPAEETHA